MKPRNTGILALIITAITAILTKEGLHAEPAAIAAAATGVVTLAHVVVHPPVRRKLRKVLPHKRKLNPSLGLWVWEGRDPHGDCKRAADAGYGWIAIKAHDGSNHFNQESINAYQAICKTYGLKFGIWGYCRGAGSAILASVLCHSLKPAFYIADCEVEMENSPRSDQKDFCTYLRMHNPDLDLWLSSFGRIDLHPDIDWRAFRDAGFGFMPQAYSCDSVELTPAACYHHARDIWEHARIQPTLGAYAGARGRLPAPVLRDECRGLQLAGVNVWDAQEATQADLAEVARVL
jgi:hypothetical protein